jgi:hypothetical protein
MTKPSPITTMAAGYASSKPLRKGPPSFQIDDRLERLVADVAEGKHPVTPAIRMQIGYYQLAKAEHRATRKEST